ncbi:polysaccharide biosynthesis protein [Desulfurococcus mucosus DSM 2162]|uniref:Polysaccharide biosynthesis protein n=1 Tax=Desulfurococcus mucosus (strain ATCC 35584 / DSM 2162 / JCM 9187 / O7/1) TaxID=765177 RepID=E8R8T9_DESM0|nr:lipopolysaccharide biosynthesis protein [Desulfurococcus mucosus]ADV64915.1 polysaccharide biosynthesis protein [Desulfurococcus mucosus DSM 2162]
MSSGDSEFAGTATQAVLYGASTITQIILQVATMMIVSRSLGPSNYGVYTLALLPSTILSIFSDPGVTSSMLRYISVAKAKGDECGVAESYRVSLLILSLVNAMLLVAIVLLPEELGAWLAQREGLGELILATAPYPLATTIYGAVLTYYAGVEKAALRSILQLLAPALRLILVSLALMLGSSVHGVIAAHVATYVVMAVTGLAVSLRELRGFEPCKGGFDLKGFLSLALSIYMIGLAGAVVGRIVGFLVAYSTSSMGEQGDFMVGNYNAANAFLGAVASILGSLTVPLTPLLAKKLNDNQAGEASTLMINVLTALTIPVAMYLVSFADAIIYSVYGRSYALAPLFFSYMSISLLAWPLQAVYGSLYWVLNDRKPLAVYGLLLMATGLATSLPLSTVMGLKGVAIAQGLYPLISSTVLAYYGYSRYRVRLNKSGAAVILVLSLTLSQLARLATLRIPMYLAQAVVGFVIYTVLFTAAAGLLKAIDEAELSLLDTLSRRTPVIGPLLSLLVKLYRRTAALTR